MPGPASDSSIGTTKSQGLSSNAWVIPAFMNRPRPMTVTVSAWVPRRSMSSRVTSKVVNTQTPQTATKHDQGLGGAAPCQVLVEMVCQLTDRQHEHQVEEELER